MNPSGFVKFLFSTVFMYDFVYNNNMTNNPRGQYGGE